MLRRKKVSILCQVSIETLIDLEEASLLAPAIVDKKNGERWYLPEQIPQLHRILLLKDLGVSYNRIADLLDEDISLAQIQELLRKKQVKLQKESEIEKRRLAHVDARLRQLEDDEITSAHRVIIKSIPAQTVVSLRKTIASYKDVHNLFNQVLSQLKRSKINPSGPPLAIYHDLEYRDQDIDVEVAVPIRIKKRTDQLLTISEFPRVKSMASVVHSDSHESISLPYAALFSWIEANKYRIVGPNREVYLQRQTFSKHAISIIEVQLPVEKST